MFSEEQCFLSGSIQFLFHMDHIFFSMNIMRIKLLLMAAEHLEGIMALKVPSVTSEKWCCADFSLDLASQQYAQAIMTGERFLNSKLFKLKACPEHRRTRPRKIPLQNRMPVSFIGLRRRRRSRLHQAVELEKYHRSRLLFHTAMALQDFERILAESLDRPCFRSRPKIRCLAAELRVGCKGSR
jgi:hypothetical protein